MNPDLPYHRYHMALLKSLFDTLRAQSVLMEQVPEESNILFLERFDEMIGQLEAGDHDSLYTGQEILCQIISRYPQIGRAAAEERGEEFNWEQARQLIQSP